MTDTYTVSFYCYYDTNRTKHTQELTLEEIPTWMKYYRFTHPDVKSISAKIWTDDGQED